MPGDRMSVPVVVRAAGPKFETDEADPKEILGGLFVLL